MRVNLEWLRDWVELGDAESVAADLTASGLEVEAVEPLAAVDRSIVVAEVLAVERHPNADRLSVCAVDDGSGRHQVVCGAPNVAPGIKAPLARVGALLPGGKAIGAAGGGQTPDTFECFDLPGSRRCRCGSVALLDRRDPPLLEGGEIAASTTRVSL